MSKNKFLKKLLIAGLCALTATAMVGATACDKGGDDGEEPGIHQTNEYTVSFNLDGGSWGKDDGYTVKVEKDGTLSATDIETPTKEGYDFAGWFNGSTPFVVGTTKVTGNITLTAHWTEHIVGDLETSQWLATSGTVGDKVEANTEINSNELFSASIGYAAEYATAANASFILRDGESKQLESGLKNTKEIETNTNSGTITFEANADITLYAYVSLSDNGYGGNRTGYIYYSVSGSDGAVMLAKEVTGFSNAPTTVKVDLKEGDTLTVYAYNTNSNGARLWLFGAEAVENIHPVTVNYYYGEQLIFRQLVEDGATLTKPEDPVNGENKFLGWYADAACETEYTFGELAAGTTSVNVYADFQAYDVVVNYYLNADDEEPWTTVNAFSGGTAENKTAADKADGSQFLGWTTKDGQDYDFNTVLVKDQTLDLYAKYKAPEAGTLVSTYTVDGTETIAAFVTNAFVLKADSDETKTIASIQFAAFNTDANGDKFAMTNAGTFPDGSDCKKQIQVNKGTDSAFATLILESGYTYTIEMYCASSASTARKITLKVGDDTFTQETSANKTDYVNCKFENLAAGTYNFTINGNALLGRIKITATPVANN
ncbi:MAG: InlB B-repeat-containing protein [Clostridia bacterium]|nr:InlB B-repeat-containing protein [Clostridia bacterium]